MKKYPKRGSFQDVKLNAEAVGFQIKESYKKARTNIAYSIVKKGCKMVSVTSSSKSEGKTITAVNIAIALAQQVDTRVLIIDCDLRRPRIQSVLEIPVDKGITNYLNFECEASDIVYTSKLEGLGMVAVEAQTSGLFCFASDRVPEDTKLTENIRYYSLNETPLEWAQKMIDEKVNWEKTRTSHLDEINEAGYNIDSSKITLVTLYDSFLNAVHR